MKDDFKWGNVCSQYVLNNQIKDFFYKTGRSYRGDIYASVVQNALDNWYEAEVWQGLTKLHESRHFTEQEAIESIEEFLKGYMSEN